MSLPNRLVVVAGLLCLVSCVGDPPKRRMNAVMEDAGPDGSTNDERDASTDTGGKGGAAGSSGSGGKAGSEPTSGKGGMGGAGAAGSVAGNSGGMGGAGASGAGDGGKGGASGSAGMMSCPSSVPGGSCNLVTSCGCPDDKACYVTDVNGSTATVGCTAPGRVSPGSLCNGRTECVEGYGCVGTMPGQCRAYCESDKDCGLKGICETVTATVDNKSVPIEGYKVCFETCTANSDCSTQCCAPGRSGQKVCAAADYCKDTCTTNADCTGGCCVTGSDGHKSCAKGQQCESVQPGGKCESSLVCVGFSANESLCVSDDEGSTCHDKCANNTECKSNCCAVTKEGTHYCTAAKYCSAPSCKAAGATCAATSECCGGPANTSTCVEQNAGPVCQPFCTANSQCPSNCCAALKNGGNVCAPVVYCQ